MMHGMSGRHRTQEAPTTEGVVLRQARTYDFFTSLVGMGAGGRTSRRIVETAGIKPGDSVLDVGCGPGSLTLAARAAAGPTGRVHGIDASPEMIKTARQKAGSAGQEVDFKVGLMEQLDFADATFDVVLSRLAIHHLPEEIQPKAFAEILRVLKPGGHALVADMPTASHSLSGHLALVLAALGARGNQPSRLISLFENAGFVSVELMPTGSLILMAVRGKKPTA
jgi:ubiquinone/menaquinone biosynthesis C-methylase UbiE